MAVHAQLVLGTMDYRFSLVHDGPGGYWLEAMYAVIKHARTSDAWNKRAVLMGNHREFRIEGGRGDGLTPFRGRRAHEDVRGPSR